MRYTRSSDLVGRFISYGLPRSLAVELGREVDKWEANSGPAWTVSRLKNLKTDFIRERAGLIPLSWVRKNRLGGWYGVWGSLRAYAKLSLKTFERVINCLMCYSSYMPSGPTETHEIKMRATVGQAPDFIPETLLKDLASHARAVLGSLCLGPSQPLATFQGRSSVKSPIWGGSSTEQDDQLEKEFKWMDDPYHRLFLNRHYASYKRVLEGVSNLSLQEPLMGLSGQAHHLSDFGPFESVHSRLRPPFMEVAAGHIVPLTKDGGWKVRWIANPYRIHQLALRPIGNALFSALLDLPWDCTFDQTKPYKRVQEHLSAGKTAYAVDLSSATDAFPLDLQLAVLEALFPQSEWYQIELFAELSRCYWLYQSRNGSEKIRWSKGQPMGLYPSFASFSLTHGLLLDLLAGGVPGRFYVLGDDVVILHKPTYERYLSVLDLLGCPHDPNKSIVSAQLTEFAGKIITPERIVSQFKWRDVGSNNFLELMRTFGQGFKSQLRRRERRVYSRVSRLLQPYGCNHSAGPGWPLEKVAYETEVFIDRLPEKRAGSVHTSFLHLLASRLKPWTGKDSLFHKICPTWFIGEAQSLDERSQSAFMNTAFCSLPGDRGILADVLEVTGNTGLPAVGPKNRVDHPSVLEWYEEVLGFTESK